MNQNIQNEMMAERAAQDAMDQDTAKSHSIMFHFKGDQEKEAERQKVQNDMQELVKDRNDIMTTDSRIRELILKKSTMDRMVPYDSQYVSLTGPGVVALSDLNVRNYRVMDNDFPDFIAEMKDTTRAWNSIANQES